MLHVVKHKPQMSNGGRMGRKVNVDSRAMTVDTHLHIELPPCNKKNDTDEVIENAEVTPEVKQEKPNKAKKNTNTSEI